jgi:K+-sensing histidine kinase KdpD
MAGLRVLVCVTGQKSCVGLIQEGARIAGELEGTVSVVHVAAQGANFLGNPKEGEALEYLYRAAEEVGADMAVIRADDALDTLVTYTQEQQADCMVVGTGRGRQGNDFAEKLRLRLPGVEVFSVYTDERRQ